MSIEAMTWALTVPVGGNQKVVLLGLANHAHPDGTETYPSLERLASYACCDRSTAKRNVRKLLEAGWILDDGAGPRGTVRYRLLMGGQNDPGASAPARGGKTTPGPGAPAPPEPSKNRKREPSKNGGAEQEALSGSDPVLERALSWLEDEIEKQVGIRPGRTAAQRRAVAKILGRFPTGQARDPMARALEFAYADRYWSTRITKPSEFEAAFTRLLSGANTSARLPQRANGREDREVPSFRRGMEIAT